jgi:glycosyltransferase involved in cell wall biosynthesis
MATHPARTRPRVSVLLVARDASAFVGEAVESLLTQGFGDFELLLYDDGSTDASAEVLARVAGRDPRVRLVRGGSRGLTAWLRHGVEEARGELIARMDADDVCHPERLERQVAFLDAHPGCVALGSDALLVDPACRPIRRLGVRLRHDEIEAELLRGRGDALLHPASMFRRADALAVGSYRTRFRVSQCLDLFLRLGERGRLANLPEPLLRYRQHPDKVSGARKGEQRRAQDEILREAYARRGLPLASLPRRPPVPESVPLGDSWHRWASWAVDAGHLGTARHYAWRLWLREPTALRSWKLALRALSGLPLETARRPAAALRRCGLRRAAGTRSSGR